jgi:hypothetical protein
LKCSERRPSELACKCRDVKRRKQKFPHACIWGKTNRLVVKATSRCGDVCRWACHASAGIIRACGLCKYENRLMQHSSQECPSISCDFLALRLETLHAADAECFRHIALRNMQNLKSRVKNQEERINACPVAKGECQQIRKTYTIQSFQQRADISLEVLFGAKEAKDAGNHRKHANPAI